MDAELKNSSTEPLFTSSQVLKAVNITYRQLSYWELKGIIKPRFQKQGSRDFKRYTQEDIDTLRRVKKLLDEGYSLPTTDTLDEIAKRKELEQKLKESEQKFRHLVETTTDWVWEVDRDGVYTYASPKVKDLLGYEVSEVIGRTPFDLMPQEKAEKISKFFYEKVANKEAFFRLENINIHKDGRQIVLETSGIPIFDEKGNLKGYRGIDRDITERKKAEEARRKSEEHFRKLIENIFKFVPESVIVFTDRLNLFKKNKAFQNIVQKYSTKLNYTEQELTEIIIEQVKNRITNSDNTEIRISKREM